MHAEEDKKKLPSEEEENQENQKEKEPEIQSKVVDLFLFLNAQSIHKRVLPSNVSSNFYFSRRLVLVVFYYSYT